MNEDFKTPVDQADPLEALAAEPHSCSLSWRPSDPHGGHLARSGIRPLEGAGRYGQDVGEGIASVPVAGDAACTVQRR